MYYFCTYLDKNYLDKGLALYRSLVRHCLPFRLWVVCMDKDAHRILTEMQLPEITPLWLSKIELADIPLLYSKSTRSQIEYYFTSTPSLLRYILKKNPEIDILTYLDADLYFFDGIEPVYTELNNNSILITGHRFPGSQKHLELYGIYNVGLLAFRNDATGMSCLNWWRHKCLDWCYDRAEDGKYADQKYLDDWPTRFTGVVVVQNPGIGVAPWNLADYNGQPVIMYHFSGLKQVSPGRWDTGLAGYKTRVSPAVKEQVYYPYLRELVDAQTQLNKYGWTPDYTLARKPSIKRRVYLSVLAFVLGIRQINQSEFIFR